MSQSASCNRKVILSAVLDVISSNSLNKIDILDLGIGKGNFGKLIKENVKIPANPVKNQKFSNGVKITGIEIWEKYRNKKWDWYDKVIITDIEKYLQRNKKKYDMILMIDVLEHFVKNRGGSVLKDAITLARKAVIVSTPITNYPQKAARGNPYEEHKSIWASDELVKMGFEEITRKQVFGLFWPPVAKLGIFIYKK